MLQFNTTLYSCSLDPTHMITRYDYKYDVYTNHHYGVIAWEDGW